MESILYEGVANVYLQGNGALQPVGSFSSKCMNYSVGTCEEIIVRDFRPEPDLAAIRTLEGTTNLPFADIFSTPSYIKIQECKQGAQIDLMDAENIIESEIPTLWLGVTEKNTFHGYEPAWYILRKTQDNRNAFAILVE